MSNMDFTKHEIRDYQTIYRKYFDVVLSDDEAKTKLNILVRQMAVIYKPVTVEQYENYRNTSTQLKETVGAK
ncbi:MAG TPA: hypothetical protein VMR18_00520 [Candidatus Saccharimonadales bacterium]|nr:hypothetical protein [Candidatus Saccharimonadales bacterium]